MPHPRPRRAARPSDAPLSPAERRELRALEIENARRAASNAWIGACKTEMLRRAQQACPRGPWQVDYDLIDRISHDYIAQGRIPPPGMRSGLYPPGWGRGGLRA
jgi:hypothetical protein